MEQVATAREFGQLSERVEGYGERIGQLEESVRDIQKAAFKILLVLCGNAFLLLIGIILYATHLK